MSLEEQCTLIPISEGGDTLKVFPNLNRIRLAYTESSVLC